MKPMNNTEALSSAVPLHCRVRHGNGCATCQYKQLNANRDKGHCYMFKVEPEPCLDWKGINVGTIGHIGHSKAGMISAILQALDRSA